MSEKFHIALEEIKIARPCRADWNAMTGDQQARFCGSCHKNVYDISQMSRADAEQLIAEKEGKLCLRLYRRADGTVMTQDCPVGIRVAQKPFKWLAAGFAALVGSGVALAHQAPQTQICPPQNGPTLTERARKMPVVGALVNLVSPQPMQGMMMGDIAPPIMGETAPVPPPTATPAPDDSPSSPEA